MFSLYSHRSDNGIAGLYRLQAEEAVLAEEVEEPPVVSEVAEDTPAAAEVCCDLALIMHLEA